MYIQCAYICVLLFFNLGNFLFLIYKEIPAGFFSKNLERKILIFKYEKSW